MYLPHLCTNENLPGNYLHVYKEGGESRSKSIHTWQGRELQQKEVLGDAGK